MFPLFQKLFEAAGFQPLGECYSWQTDVLVANVSGNALIALTYFSVPFTLYQLTKHRKFFIHRYILVLFSIFITFCALRHVIEIVSVWQPVFNLQGIFKILTGIMAIITMVVFYRSFPKALGLDKANALKQTNDRLLEEVAERERAQVALRQANEALDSRVQQRTSQLIKTNRELEREIEQRKKTEQDLLEKNKELSRINAELDNFVYQASHDLKDPIVQIEGLVTALKEEIPQASPSVNQIFAHLDGSLLKVDKTVLDLTEVGKVQKTAENEPCEEIEFQEICQEVSNELEDQLAQANATVISDFSQAPGICFTRQNLKRICSNLLLNALHMRNPNKPLQISIATEAVSDYIRIKITENGSGIANPGPGGNRKPQINAENQHSAGFGLSLYIVQRILNNCNGQLKIQSEPGKGSVFEVLLPARIYQNS